MSGTLGATRSLFPRPVRDPGPARASAAWQRRTGGAWVAAIEEGPDRAGARVTRVSIISGVQGRRPPQRSGSTRLQSGNKLRAIGLQTDLSPMTAQPPYRPECPSPGSGDAGGAAL